MDEDLSNTFYRSASDRTAQENDSHGHQTSRPGVTADEMANMTREMMNMRREMERMKNEQEAQLQRAMQPQIEEQLFQRMQEQVRMGRMDINELQEETKVPRPKDMKLHIIAFDGKETYEGLGSGFQQWGMRFLRQLEIAEQACGFRWPEIVKCDCLSAHLVGKPLRYFQNQHTLWWEQEQTLLHAMNMLHKAYASTLSAGDALKLLSKPKVKHRNWLEHYQYLVAVGVCMGGSQELVLQSLVKHSSVQLRDVLMARYNPARTDYLVHAEELAQFAQLIDSEHNNSRKLGSELDVNSTETRSCYNCNKQGHIARDCRSKRNNNWNNNSRNNGRYNNNNRGNKKEKDSSRFVFALTQDEENISDSDGYDHGRKRRHTIEDFNEDSRERNSSNDEDMPQGDNDIPDVYNMSMEREKDIIWILDSGAATHVTGNKRLLFNLKRTSTALRLPNGMIVKGNQSGSTMIKVTTGKENHNITIKDIMYVPDVSRNLLSMVTLEKRGVTLKYINDERYLVYRNQVVCKIDEKNGVLIVKSHTNDEDDENENRELIQRDNIASEILVKAIETNTNEIVETNGDVDIHEGSLMDFHERFGHLNFDSIIKLSKTPGSGIRLTDTTRRNCITCAEGKQTKNNSKHTDSGANAPITRIGGVICSDIKGPMTPRDRLGNRYLINFIDYKTNYCRIFLAKTKDAAAKQFEHFLVFFEKRFNCKVLTLRTDGGGEYVNVDLFCRRNGVSRQITEARNSASNGKVERMHRTILNMARCMIFGSRLPLMFWGDAVKYSAYVLNRCPTRSNPRSKSPLEMLEGTASNLTDIVAFGSECTVYRHPLKNSLKQRGNSAIILGKSEETKGFIVYIRKEKKVTTTQHVRNIETLTSVQNLKLQARFEIAEDDDANLDRGRDVPPVGEDNDNGRSERRKRSTRVRQIDSDDDDDNAGDSSNDDTANGDTADRRTDRNNRDRRTGQLTENEQGRRRTDLQTSEDNGRRRAELQSEGAASENKSARAKGKEKRIRRPSQRARDIIDSNTDSTKHRIRKSTNTNKTNGKSQGVSNRDASDKTKRKSSKKDKDMSNKAKRKNEQSAGGYNSIGYAANNTSNDDMGNKKDNAINTIVDELATSDEDSNYHDEQWDNDDDYHDELWRQKDDTLNEILNRYDDEYKEENEYKNAYKVDVLTGEINALDNPNIDPPNYRKAMESKHHIKWKLAIKKEIEDLQSNNTWSVIERPPESKPLHTKWVFKTKRDENGNIKRHKARLVACGNEQVQGDTFMDTFAPVMEIGMAKVILAMAHLWGRHADIPNAYVKAQTEQEYTILLNIPQGLTLTIEQQRMKSPVLQLHKGLYGLRQAGKLWNTHLHNTILDMDFKRSKTDMCIYWRRRNDSITVIGVYVDDLLITGNDNVSVNIVMEKLKSLDVKDLGNVAKFLGMRVKKTELGYTLDQQVNISDIIVKYGLENAATTVQPIGGDFDNIESEKLPEGTPQDFTMPSKSVLRSITGALLWIARCTRPDISYAVHKLTRRAHEPTISDWNLARKILKYLKGTINMVLHMEDINEKSDKWKIVGYSDADYASDPSTRKSITGGMIELNGMPIAWICAKQESVSLSTMESEFIAASHVTREIMGFIRMFEEFGLPMEKAKLYCDNQAAIAQLSNTSSSQRAKHIDIRYKYIQEHIQNEYLGVEYVHTEEMKADMMTKSFPAPRLKKLRMMNNVY